MAVFPLEKDSAWDGNPCSKSVKIDGKLMDKVRRIVHPKLRPFHFQIKTYYLWDANYPTDNPSLVWIRPIVIYFTGYIICFIISGLFIAMRSNTLETKRSTTFTTWQQCKYQNVRKQKAKYLQNFFRKLCVNRFFFIAWCYFLFTWAI